MPESTENVSHATTFGARLKWLREFKGLNVRQFASRVGCDPGYISKLENGKATNPSDRFLITVTSCFTASEAWLRDGAGEPILSRLQTDATRNALNDWSEKRIQRILAVIDDLPEALATDAVLGLLLRELTLEQLRELMVEVSKLPNMPATAKAFWFDALGRLQGPMVLGSSKVSVDTIHESVNSLDVKAQWPVLKKRLQEATQPVGTKSKLAKFLGVKLASVSQWLSDSDSQREPGAETTLQLLKWVELQEGKTK